MKDINEETIWKNYKPVFQNDYFGNSDHFSTEDKLRLQKFTNRALREQVKEMRENQKTLFKMIKDIHGKLNI